MEYGLLKDIVLLLGLALLTLLLFRQFKIPSVIGFLVTGIIAGPHALGLVSNIEEVEQMAEIGVVLLMGTPQQLSVASTLFDSPTGKS